jgi:1-acyl-sn-glycerol-3-phosphate acyltransferase
VLVFPEGTTSDGHGLRRFQPRPFAVAQRSGCPVQPVAIRYGSNDAPDPIAPFVGDDSLAAHLLRVLRRPGIRVEVSFLPVIQRQELDRRHLAASSRAAIAERLGVSEALARGSRIPRDAGPRQHIPPTASPTSSETYTPSA